MANISSLLPPAFVRHFRPLIYIMFSDVALLARCVGTQRVYDTLPIMARHSRNRRVVAVGQDCFEAKAQLGDEVIIHHIFDHPRILVADLDMSEALFRYVLNKLRPTWLQQTGLPSLRPHIILHPQRSFPDGYTSLEVESLRTILQKAGGYDVYVWNGDTLTDKETLSGQFPAQGWIGEVPRWSRL